MGSDLNLDDYIRRTRDRFVYVTLRAPSFPPEDRTTTVEQFAKLHNGIDEILRRTRKRDRRRWLELTRRELEQALAAYESGDRDRGIDIMYAAEEHYKNAIRGTKYDVTASPEIADEESIESAADSGGPEEAIFEEEVRYEAQEIVEAEERFTQWLKEHPKSEWHRVLATPESSEHPPLRPSGGSQPIPALPVLGWRPQRPPYRITAAVSWILPVICVVGWVLVPRPANSPMNRTLTGAAHLGFAIGLIISVIALVGATRRGGNKVPAIVGLVVNAVLIFAFPK